MVVMARLFSEVGETLTEWQWVDRVEGSLNQAKAVRRASYREVKTMIVDGA